MEDRSANLTSMILKYWTGIKRLVRAPIETIPSLDVGKKTWINNDTICLVEVKTD